MTTIDLLAHKNAKASDDGDSALNRLPLQETSLDIWDKKYRLKTKDGDNVDHTVSDTFRRVARALADVERNEADREHWYDEFLWALEHGAIPAGRITSNAGALAHKPATSTINCTVSGTVVDSMDNILHKVHEAGLTLKAGCGIGYDFSTLRPHGAYVSGAGAYTSGPLSFMDIFDKMCFTVSSAGGRRGAQMGTFDIRHPDVLEFIKAKREDGRLRQFNLSLLITEDFIQAVKADEQWQLAFPIREKELENDDIKLDDPDQIVWRDWPSHENVVVNDAGLVACRIYKTLPARRLWDLIMASTYDFAEPGFILIDKVNEMNNNWFDETIRATNPCVTKDTWVQTEGGPRQVAELLGQPFVAIVDGQPHTSGVDGFYRTARKAVVRLQTAEGYQLRLTADHRVRRVSAYTAESTDTEWCAAGDLRTGDRVLLNDHRQAASWAGALSEAEGYQLGLMIADNATLSVWAQATAVNGPVENIGGQHQTSTGTQRTTATGSSARNTIASELGLEAGDHRITPALEKASSAGYVGLLRGLFDANGAVVEKTSIRLTQSDLPNLEAVQRMLLRLGIAANVLSDRRASRSVQVPESLRSTHGAGRHVDISTQHELIINGANIARFAALIGFADTDKQQQLDDLLANTGDKPSRERYVARVVRVEDDGIEDVYDVQVPGINTFDANGLHAHNCGEQPLPPYGACLLGSINLTRFVLDPFTAEARFDWQGFNRTVDIFTRMLDNVVEINGLPLEQQRKEILRKRRHGMGYLGLGSTLTLLGMRYGSQESLDFTEEVTRELAMTGWRAALALAKEKGPAPIMEEMFTVTGEMLRKRPEMTQQGYKVGDKIPGRVLHARYSRYMQQVGELDPALIDELAANGARFTHHSSIAPTGTISLSLANNASNGIEPSFAHHYSRNVIREGRKTKEKVDVHSFELLAYRALINPEAMPFADDEANQLPDYFIAADDIEPKDHVAVQ